MKGTEKRGKQTISNKQLTDDCHRFGGREASLADKAKVEASSVADKAKAELNKAGEKAKEVAAKVTG